MATRIRLRRVGRKGLPLYRIVVADQEAPRDGRFIEILGTVGRSHNDDSFGGIEPIHRREEGIVRLLGFAILIELAIFSEAIDLVDEDNGGLMFAGFLEKLADSLRAHADIYFVKVTSAGTEKIGICFSRNGFGKHCLSGSWWAE